MSDEIVWKSPVSTESLLSMNAISEQYDHFLESLNEEDPDGDSSELSVSQTPSGRLTDVWLMTI
ncbi:hypothetical protein N7462_010590 [Penicillium macrosclerotiorum]|uniref:uncharacterized protein n=1 Tax=Penicillium macrosclerotiorum TaxID=303699 RepID=UPI002548BFFA|nr:uncharacterized protein N7462_010590 [Penicillium macrosclerotiorum]KAJ5669520.1 hypothetical protein N7462_010590 [Penicillium macrosclerotiorum]